MGSLGLAEMLVKHFSADLCSAGECWSEGTIKGMGQQPDSKQ